MSLAKINPPLTNKRIYDLFDKFSWPLRRSCITDHQKDLALMISKMLWLRLVTGTDTKETIAQDLKLVFPDHHDSVVAFGALYFLKMKTALKDSAIKKLKEHYAYQTKLKRTAAAKPGDASVMRA